MMFLGGRLSRPGRKFRTNSRAPGRPARLDRTRTRRPALVSRAGRAALLVWLALCAVAPVRPVLAASPREPLFQAQKLFDAGRFAEAGALLAETLKREPADERLWALLGRVKARLGERAGALEALRLALRLSPADTLTRMRLDMLTDVAPEAAASRGRAEPAAAAARPPSALERAASEELARAQADPEHAGCGAVASVVLDPLWSPVPDLPLPIQAGQPVSSSPSSRPSQAGADAALELSGLVAARLAASGAGAVLTRHGPYPVRQDERAALAELSGGACYLALAVTGAPGNAPSLEALVLGPSGAGVPGAAAARLAALAGADGAAGPISPMGQAALVASAGIFGQFAGAGAMGLKPSAVERLHALIRRTELERQGRALAERILARCRADGSAAPARDKDGPVAGEVALLAAIDRPAVLLAVNIPPGPEPGRREVLDKLAASLAACLLEAAGPCP